MNNDAQQQLSEIHMSAREIIAMRDEHDRQERAKLAGFVVGFVLTLVTAFYVATLVPAAAWLLWLI